MLPLAFIVVLMFASQRYGMETGVLGGLATAVTFACFYSHPDGGRVPDPAFRNNLAWMLLLGIPTSYFVVPPAAPIWQKRHQSSFPR